MEKENYISLQPAHLFLNTKRTLPELPMFLEDGYFPIIQKGKTNLYPGFFVGFDAQDCMLILHKPKGNGIFNYIVDGK